MNRANPIVDFAAKGYESRGKRIFAPKVGEAPSLVAGSSRSILSPSAIEELFLFQRTANGAGGTGAAIFQSIKGNSIVWNQLVQNGNFASGTANWFASANASISVASGECTITSTGTLTGARQNLTTAVVAGHKYIIRASVKGASGGEVVRVGVQSTGMTINGTATATYAEFSGVFTANNTGTVFELSTTGGSIAAKDVNLIDITASTMSVTSVSDFTKFYGLPYYAPNPGAIKNNCATGMVTDGFNQWDEVWENGSYKSNDGTPIEGTNVRSKSDRPIKVSPSTNYYFRSSTPSVHRMVYFYTPEDTYISSYEYSADGIVTTPANCGYIRFVMFLGYGTTYNHDICINISGPRNGQYEPLWSDTTALPITTATGKLNGEGESVVISPNGLAGVGSVFDEAIVEKGMWTKTILRVGNRAYQEGDEDDATLLTDGVTTNYPLVTPEEYILDTPVPVVAKVDENGTQTITPQGVDGSGVPMTAPFAADIQYPQRMSEEYITAASMKNILDGLVTAEVIPGYSLTYDPVDAEYDFEVVTPTPGGA